MPVDRGLQRITEEGYKRIWEHIKRGRPNKLKILLGSLDGDSREEALRELPTKVGRWKRQEPLEWLLEHVQERVGMMLTKTNQAIINSHQADIDKYKACAETLIENGASLNTALLNASAKLGHWNDTTTDM